METVDLDLPKAFVGLFHGSSIAKHYAFGLSEAAMFNYLNVCKL